MDDATYTWTSEVNNAANEVDSLRSDVDRLAHEIADLVHLIRDKGLERFDDDVEDYTILENARQLWDTVSSGCSDVRSRIHDAANAIRDINTSARMIGR